MDSSSSVCVYQCRCLKKLCPHVSVMHVSFASGDYVLLLFWFTQIYPSLTSYSHACQWRHALCSLVLRILLEYISLWDYLLVMEKPQQFEPITRVDLVQGAAYLYYAREGIKNRVLNLGVSVNYHRQG